MRNLFIRAMNEAIEGLSEREKIYLHNEYCREVGYNDDEIFTYDDINELFSYIEPTEIIEKFADIAYSDYWYFNGYGNAVALDDIDDVMDSDAISTYCLDNAESLYCDFLTRLIDLYEGIDDLQDRIRDELKELGYPRNEISIEQFSEIFDKVEGFSDYDEYFNYTEFIQNLYDVTE